MSEGAIRSICRHGETKVILSADSRCPDCNGSLQDHLKPSGYRCRVCETVFPIIRNMPQTKPKK
jgi:tRNA(Ile2) C34 agmatinyltransferase TiaS